MPKVNWKLILTNRCILFSTLHFDGSTSNVILLISSSSQSRRFVLQTDKWNSTLVPYHKISRHFPPRRHKTKYCGTLPPPPPPDADGRTHITHTQACKPKISAGGRGKGENLFLSGYRTWANLIRASLAQTHPVSLRESATQHTSGWRRKVETRVRNEPPPPRVRYTAAVSGGEGVTLRELLYFTTLSSRTHTPMSRLRSLIIIIIIGPSYPRYGYFRVYEKPTVVVG